MRENDPSLGWFRPTVGILALLAGAAGLLALYFVPVPTGNMQALLLGLGIVLGWGGSVVQSEFGQSASGRKLADKIARSIQAE